MLVKISLILKIKLEEKNPDEMNLRIIQLFQYYGLAKNLERQLVNLDIHITSESKKY